MVRLTTKTQRILCYLHDLLVVVYNLLVYLYHCYNLDYYLQRYCNYETRIMPNCQYKSIDDLCEAQLHHVRAGLQLTNRTIGQDVFQAVCNKDNPGITKHKDADFIVYLYELLKHEEAYELVELRQLDYTSRFTVKVDSKYDEQEGKVVTTEYLHLKRPPITCSHYDNCRAYVFGPDCKLETVADILFGAEAKLELEWSKAFCSRLRGALATLKISPRNPLLIHGFKAIALFGYIGSLDETLEQAKKYKVGYEAVSEMFAIYPPESRFIPVEAPAQDLARPFRGDSFRHNGIKGCLAAKMRLATTRPYIMCTYVWSDETNWLECLIHNINHLSIKEVGILCPDRKTVDQITSRPNHSLLSVRVGTLDEWPESSFDYLIIYKAHSIGPAEAIGPLLTIKADGCVVLVGDPKMPNLRVRSQLVRETCGSILQWFHNRGRYPEYFEEGSVCVERSPVCFGYNPKIFSIFNEMFYNSELINMVDQYGRETGEDEESSLSYYPTEGIARISGCSPYNIAEAGVCLELAKVLVENGISGSRIGVLTTYCAQKRKITNLLRDESLCSGVAVGIPQDFENETRDCFIISTVETALRARDGKRYPFDDLLYDKLCFNLALTRAKRKIIVVGDKDVLSKIDHWSKLIDRCTVLDEKEFS